MLRLTDLREILRYVPQFRDRVFVIALDGAIVEHENFSNLLLDIALLRSLRIGVIRHFYTRDVAGDPEQVEALDAAVKLLAEAGAEISEITLPALQDFSACGQIIIAAEAYAVHEQWLKERPEDYGARARERLLAGATLRAVDYLQAVRWRLQLRDRLRVKLQRQRRRGVLQMMRL